MFGTLLEAWTIFKFNAEITGDTKYTKSFDSDPLVHLGFWNDREPNVFKRHNEV